MKPTSDPDLTDPVTPATDREVEAMRVIARRYWSGTDGDNPWLAVLARLDAAEADNARLRTLLREVEWKGAVICGEAGPNATSRSKVMTGCYFCGRLRACHEPHAPDCRLAAALKEAAGE